MLQVSVQGGTGAGRRIVHPKPEGWECEVCDRFNAGHWTRCPNCGTRRPR